jgi:hypothetical protein
MKHFILFLIDQLKLLEYASIPNYSLLQEKINKSVGKINYNDQTSENLIVSLI